MQSLLVSAADAQSTAVTSEMGNTACGEFVVRSLEPSPSPDPYGEEITTVFTPAAENPLPTTVAQQLVSGMSGVSERDTDRLRSWMRERGLRATIWTNAARYLVDMKVEDRALQQARRRPDPQYGISIYESGKGLFWIGNDRPNSEIFLTHGGRTRQLHTGDPVRLRPGDVVTCGDSSFEFVQDYRGTHFRHAETPVVLRADEPTVIMRRPVAS